MNLTLEQQISSVEYSINAVKTSLARAREGTQSFVALRSHLQTLERQLAILKSQRSEQ